MPLILPGNVASATAPTTFSVANSCRFNDDDSSYLHITPSAGDRDRFTFSCWVKRGVLGAANALFTVLSGSNYSEMYFGSSNQIYWDEYPGSLVGRLVTNRVFRDCSAWYHLVFVYDSANATAGNRMRLYVNGVEETSFATDTQPSSGQDSFFNGNLKHMIGGHTGGSEWVDGYMAEVVFCDGQAYAASDFGEFDEDSPTIWKPKDVSSLTFGTNGFYLDFEDSSNLGNDKNGGTDLTEVNLAATDQTTDTPTNNFCTMNPLNNYYAGATFSEGNCKIVTANSSVHARVSSTIGLSAGKWYWEMKCTSGAEDSGANYDITGIEAYPAGATSHEVGNDSESYGYRSDNGQSYTNNSGSSYGDDWDDPDIIGVYLDLDNSKLYFAKNGTVQNSGTGISITATSSTSTGFYFPAICDFGGGTGTYEMNFGNPTWSLSSAVADKNGYGSFEYNPSTGTFDGASKDFLAICTKNLGSDGG